MDENDVRCVLCSAPKNPDGFEGVLGNPEICRLLTKATGNPVTYTHSLCLDVKFDIFFFCAD